MTDEMKIETWLGPGAAVPITADTVAVLLRALRAERMRHPNGSCACFWDGAVQTGWCREHHYGQKKEAIMRLADLVEREGKRVADFIRMAEAILEDAANGGSSEPMACGCGCGSGTNCGTAGKP